MSHLQFLLLFFMMMVDSDVQIVLRASTHNYNFFDYNNNNLHRPNNRKYTNTVSIQNEIATITLVLHCQEKSGYSIRRDYMELFHLSSKETPFCSGSQTLSSADQ